MTRRRKMLLTVTMFAGLTFSASSCVIPLGNGCNLLLFEPGVQAGVACNF